jgi:hypothetical protein
MTAEADDRSARKFSSSGAQVTVRCQVSDSRISIARVKPFSLRTCSLMGAPVLPVIGWALSVIDP